MRNNGLKSEASPFPATVGGCNLRSNVNRVTANLENMENMEYSGNFENSQNFRGHSCKTWKTERRYKYAV